MSDFRYALRLLVKDKSFTLTALLTLAICIGANVAMFSVVRSVVLKPLPFKGSERVVYLYNSYPNAGAPRVGTAVPDYFDRITAVPALDRQALFRQEGATYGDDNSSERLNVIRATPSLYRLVEMQPFGGRLFTDDEGEVGKDNKVILSYAFWQRKFAGDSSVIGKIIRLGGNPFEVVGVAPAGFAFLQNNFDLFLPASFPPAAKSDQQRHSNNWQMIGRLAPGATIEQVRQQITSLNASNDKKFPEFHQILKDADFHTIVVLLQDDLIRDVKSSLYLLWGAVAFVLVIGCVNIANLVIVRSNSRTRELATRHAIGGDLGRLARQLLTETTVLALCGGVLGLLFGWWTLSSVPALNLDQLPRGFEISLDLTTVAAILALTVFVGLAIGLAPVLRLRRMNLNVELREESRGGTSSRRVNFVRRALATVQVAIALALLVGAGLLVSSFRAVMKLDLGFNPDNVITAAVSPPATTYKDPPSLVTFVSRSLELIRAIPGVDAAAVTTLIPFSGNVSNSVILAEGHTMKPGESLIAPSTAIASAGYFEAMHIPILKGRAFDARDTATSPRAVIIDERLAQKFWPDQDPIGRRLYTPSDPKDIAKITPQTQFLNVVGLAKEVQLIDPRADIKPVGLVYYAFDQQTQRAISFVVHTSIPSASIGNDIRREVAKLDAQLPVYRTKTMHEWIDQALIGRRVPMIIAITFGIVALLLSALGIYGVLAYGVSQRQRELGVRLALGGTTGSVFRLVLTEGTRIVGIGVAAGLAGAFVVGQLMKAELFNVTPLNPIVIGTTTAVLVIVALIATAIPAWRASKIDPIIALGR